MKTKALGFFSLSLLFLTLADCIAQESQPTACNVSQIEALQTNPGQTNEALSSIASCLMEMDGTLDVDVDDNFKPTYCIDDAQLSDTIRLTNLEIRMAAVEEYNGTFCCSANECAKNCPTIDNLSNDTCGPDKKTPHAPGLLTTDDIPTRIQNLANRVLALRPKVMAFETGDFGDFGDDDGSDSGLDDTDTKSDDGTSTDTSGDSSSDSGL